LDAQEVDDVGLPVEGVGPVAKLRQ
jgi:hypothetical protein